jgi:hypothetical protein
MDEQKSGKKENNMTNKPLLKLPLIGNKKIECFSLFKNNNIEIPQVHIESGLFSKLEKALGDYLYDTKNYRIILDLLFPKPDAINIERVEAIVYESKKTDEPDEPDEPLFTKIISGNIYDCSLCDKDIKDNNCKNEKDIRHSAWANLMLELGEFKLDLESDECPKDLRYTYSTSETESFALNAIFESPEGILEEIWSRILGDDTFDTLMVFIDDDPDFDHKWGIKLLKYDEIDPKNFELGNRIWLNPGKDYNKEDTEREIKKIVESFEGLEEKSKEKKLVFIVDLLYQKKDINRIKGNEIIQHLRKSYHRVNPLIIGFTGGKSPFIINSAVKAGADIVIMKERPSSGSGSSPHSQSDPGGLFDLLWALSKNISRWRFLESYKDFVFKNISGKDFHYEPVLDKLFFSIENESPFWKNYLSDWHREIEDLRLKAILLEGK